MDDRALDDALEGGRGLGVFPVIDIERGQFVGDVVRERAAQRVDVDRARAHDGGRVLVVDQRQQQMLQRREFMPPLAEGTILYMPTLLEVPVIGTTFGYTSGVMAGGPALALLLSGPSVSLPSLLVISRIMGPKKTVVYAGLVIVFSAVAGFVYGLFIMSMPWDQTI